MSERILLNKNGHFLLVDEGIELKEELMEGVGIFSDYEDLSKETGLSADTLKSKIFKIEMSCNGDLLIKMFNASHLIDLDSVSFNDDGNTVFCHTLEEYINEFSL